MNILQKELIKKNLLKNYSTRETEVTEFHVIGSTDTYYFNDEHKKTMALFLKFELEKIGFKIETEKFFIAGGSVLTLLLYGSPFLIRDVDVFPQSTDDFIKLKEKFDFLLKTQNAIHPLKYYNSFDSLNSIKYTFQSISIDLIKTPYQTAEELFKKFDLSIVKLCFDQDFNFYKKCSLKEIFSFKMNYTQTITPENALTALNRILKYSEKGFNINKSILSEIYAVIKTNKTLDDKECFEIKKEADEKLHINEYSNLKPISLKDLDF